MSAGSASARCGPKLNAQNASAALAAGGLCDCSAVDEVVAHNSSPYIDRNYAFMFRNCNIDLQRAIDARAGRSAAGAAAG